MNLGWPEMMLLLGLGLLLFGPSKLPDLGRSMGEAIRGFKKGLNEVDKEANPRNYSNTPAQQPTAQLEQHGQPDPIVTQTTAEKEKI